jgi:hypothetical protein
LQQTLAFADGGFRALSLDRFRLQLFVGAAFTMAQRCPNASSGSGVRATAVKSPDTTLVKVSVRLRICSRT